MNTLLSVCLVALLSVYGGEALQCYECTWSSFETSNDILQAQLNAAAVATNQPLCRSTWDDFVATGIPTPTCAANEDQCGKTYFDLTGQMTGVEVTIVTYFRGCFDSSRGDGNTGCTTDVDEILETAESTITEATGEAKSCACDTDLCNSAPTLMIASATLLFSLVAAALFM